MTEPLILSQPESPVLPFPDKENISEQQTIAKRRSQQRFAADNKLAPQQAKEAIGDYSNSRSITLKAISLWQPWASLIPLGLKHYETRSWKTNYRGKVLICSTAINSKQHKQYLKICEQLQLPPWENFPHGCAIALCDLVDCIEMTAEFISQQSTTEILCGDWQMGRYAWKLENIQGITEPLAVKGKQGLFNVYPAIQEDLNELLQRLNDACSNSKQLQGDIKINPSKSPSKVDLSPGKRRQRGNGSGYIHWRTITKNGKDYPQAYYHWKENGQKKTKYIPKQLLGLVEEAEAAKRPVIEILGLLGAASCSSKLLGDIKVNPSNDEVLGDIKVNPSNDEVLGDIKVNPSNDAAINPSNDISPSKMRRYKGEGSGTIHWRTITKGGKDYPQAYYHYEFWNGGDREVKSTKYIPKRLLAQVQQLDIEKAPVREILQLLG
ncbi:MAG: ASCH domain-containing protein [Hassallia sp. WJT32-NPBG1]|jgi:hypothetical protein|nr:ASCH domain-containing protein [Hassallia sp. WJT32-NPBG1]